MARYFFALLTGLFCCASTLIAQPHSPRSEDHFFRRRVVMRMDLNEKVNRPLVAHPAIMGESPKPGLIGSLMEGLQKGAYAAYDPDRLSTPLSYEDVISHMELMVNGDQTTNIFPTDTVPTDDLFPLDSSSQDQFPLNGGGMFDPTNPSFTDFEQVVQVVEDWIFDRNRGEMIYRPLFIQVVWSDPMEVLPEKFVAVFKYEDVQNVLDQTPYPNRFNDAETRSLREIFELRLYHAYVTEISGYGVYSLEEAKRRHDALVEFEHHLWSR